MDSPFVHSSGYVFTLEGAWPKLFSINDSFVSASSSPVHFDPPVYQMEVCGKKSNLCMCLCATLYRLRQARVTDKRVRVMNEIISGMRLIKMYAWEWAFHEYVKKIRKLAVINTIYVIYNEYIL